MKQFKLFLQLTFIFILIISCNSEDEPQEVKITVSTEDIAFTINENPENNKKIGTIYGTTNKGAVTFSILNQQPSNSFTINSSTGEIFVNDKSIYDYETITSITGLIRVSNGEIFKESSITINLNDLVEDIFEGNVTLKTQEEVNEFGKNRYKEITGSLELDLDINDPIVDLTPLNTVEIIRASLDISRIEKIKSLEGLNNITIIGESLYIFNNPILEDINALKKLTVVKRIIISSNPKINSLECFSNITKLEGSCSISKNHSLLDVKGLENIESIGGSLEIDDNKKLNNIFNLSSLKTINHIMKIQNNPVLVNLNGLNNLEKINSYMWILNNSSLFDIDALENLTYIGINKSYINSNDNLQSINLKGLSSVFSLQIANNHKLKNLDGLINLTSVSDELYLASNKILDDFCGIKNLITTSPSVIFKTSNNLYNPTKEDITNGKCSN